MIKKTIALIKPGNASVMSAARERISRLTMPYWALGKILDLSVDLCAMTGVIPPAVKRKTIVVMAGDHGVTEEGVSLYPKEVTAQMIYNFTSGGAAINVLARLAGARVVVCDLGVAADIMDPGTGAGIINKKIRKGTHNIAKGPAMTREEAVRSIEAGIDIANRLSGDTDIFATGEMGIGNTTPSAAIASVITGKPVSSVTGTGTGIDEKQLRRKMSVIEKAVEINAPDVSDGIDILAKLGGFEIGGLAGLILGAAALGRPVVIDGFISTAAALIADKISQSCRNYMISAHKSAEGGHAIMLDHLGLKPLLDLNLRLGEGSGAALAFSLIDASARIISEMATFDQAHVSESVK